MNEIAMILLSIARPVLQVLPDAPRGQSNLGYIILGIIVSPVIVLLLMSVLGRPRKMSITVIFLGFLVFMLVGFITVTYALSFITGFFY